MARLSTLFAIAGIRLTIQTGNATICYEYTPFDPATVAGGFEQGSSSLLLACLNNAAGSSFAAIRS